MYYPAPVPTPITFSRAIKAGLILVLTIPLCAVIIVGFLYLQARKLF